MAERIQLKTPGSEAVLHVLSAKPETVGQTEYWVFSSGTQEIAVPASSVKGRLERMGVAMATNLIGKTIKFGRSVKTNQGGKPFWEMDLVQVGNGTPPLQSATGNPPAANVAAPSAEPAKPKMRDAYKSITEWVFKEIAPIYDDFAPESFTPEVAAACTQTLFIQACKSGKVE